MLSFNWYTNPHENSFTLQELCLCHIQWHSQPQHGTITDNLVADRPDNSFNTHMRSRPLLESTDIALWSVLCIPMMSGKLPMDPCGLKMGEAWWPIYITSWHPPLLWTLEWLSEKRDEVTAEVTRTNALHYHHQVKNTEVLLSIPLTYRGPLLYCC